MTTLIKLLRIKLVKSKTMINVAIVEDIKVESYLLKSMLEEYSKTTDTSFSINVYNDISAFLANNNNLDIVFLDIELGDGNGMDLAKKIRETDKRIMIIFVTNMAQYAVKGYEVRAFDFIVKPVVYENFKVKLTSALRCLQQKKDVSILISNKDGKIHIKSSNIKFVEVVQHTLMYHLADGSVISASGQLNNVEKELSGAPFALCNRCYLVNLKYVTAVSGYDCYLGKDKLLISRMKRSSFIRALNDYLAEGD